MTKKEFNDLKIKRQQKIEARNAKIDEAGKFTQTARSEKRQLTDDERTKWDALNAEVRAMNQEIADFEVEIENESQRFIDGGGVEGGEEGPEGKKVNIHRGKDSVYSVGKAIREWNKGGADKLTGIEAEQHQELSRGIASEGLLVPFSETARASKRDQNTTSNATSIDTIIDPNLSILGQEPLWAQLGMTVLPGLQGSFKLGKKTPDVAGKYAEKASVSQTANVPSYITFAPERYGITDIFTKELLAQENPAVQAAIVNDMIKGVDRKITAEAYAVALAAATEVAAGALTVDGLNALAAAVDADGAFAMTRASFFEGKAVKVDAGSGLFLLKPAAMNGVGNTHDGSKVVYSTLFADGVNQQYLIYGAWAEQYLGFWGALEILMNPYSYQKTGQIEMTVNRLAYMAVRNAAAFVKSPDLDAAV